MKHLIIYENYNTEELKEQNGNVSIAWTNDSESIKIISLFNMEFIPTILGNVENVTVADYISKLEGITDIQLKGAIDFFNKNGYTQPNDKIKKMQEDLMKMTNFQEFITSEGKISNFNDGVFGIATSKVCIKIMLDGLKKTTNKVQTVGQMRDTAKKIQSAQQIPAKKMNTGSSVKIDTATQKIK